MRRRELCPASLRLEDGLPALPAGPDAERGTRIHALVAKWIEAKKAPEPETEEEEDDDDEEDDEVEEDIDVGGADDDLL